MGSGDLSMITKAELLDEYNLRLPAGVPKYTTWQDVATAYIQALQKDILRNIRMMQARQAADQEVIE